MMKLSSHCQSVCTCVMERTCMHECSCTFAAFGDNFVVEVVVVATMVVAAEAAKAAVVAKAAVAAEVALATMAVEEAEAADIFWDSLSGRTQALAAPNSFKTHLGRSYK